MPTGTTASGLLQGCTLFRKCAGSGRSHKNPVVMIASSTTLAVSARARERKKKKKSAATTNVGATKKQKTARVSRKKNVVVTCSCVRCEGGPSGHRMDPTNAKPDRPKTDNRYSHLTYSFRIVTLKSELQRQHRRKGEGCRCSFYAQLSHDTK